MAKNPVIKPGEGLTDAPQDGNTYGREDGEWVIVEGFPEAPLDGRQYARQSLNGVDGAWTPVESGGGEYPPMPPNDGNEYVLEDGEWVVLTHDGGVYTGSGIPEAGIINPNGDSSVPATMALIGVWSPGDVVSVDVNVDGAVSTASITIVDQFTAVAASQALAEAIALIANIDTATSDAVIEVMVVGGGTSVVLSNAQVVPVAGERNVDITEGDLIQQARTHLPGVAPGPNSLQPGQLVVNPSDSIMWVGDYEGNPVEIGGSGGVTFLRDLEDTDVDAPPAINDVLIWDGANWINIPATDLPGGGGGGESNTSSNAGAGEGLALPKSGVDLPFKSLVAGTGISVTGNPDNITIATTGATSSPVIEIPVGQPAHGFALAEAVRYSGTAWVKAQMDSPTGVALGIVSEVTDADNFKLTMVGRAEVPGHGLSLNEWMYVSDITAGALTPVAPALEQPIVYVESASVLWVFPYRPNDSGGAAIAALRSEVGRMATRINYLESKLGA